ncbi:MAG: hypothetical protein H6Q67_1666 [Firmicutes bacterium]|nr:hypothetical protein [Bacillota bacterium]
MTKTIALFSTSSPLAAFLKSAGYRVIDLPAHPPSYADAILFRRMRGHESFFPDGEITHTSFGVWELSSDDTLRIDVTGMSHSQILAILQARLRHRTRLS